MQIAGGGDVEAKVSSSKVSRCDDRWMYCIKCGFCFDGSLVSHVVYASPATGIDSIDSISFH